VLQACSCYETLPDDLLACFALPTAGAVLCCIGIRNGVVGRCLGLIAAAWLWLLLLLLLHWLLLLLLLWGWGWRWGQRHLCLWWLSRECWYLLAVTAAAASAGCVPHKGEALQAGCLAADVLR
jgi:hypothetical protein